MSTARVGKEGVGADLLGLKKKFGSWNPRRTRRILREYLAFPIKKYLKL